MDFLQSNEWRKFQEAVGRKTFEITNLPSPLASLPQAGEGDNGFHASIIEHSLPIVGKYFYVPRGPIIKKEEEGRMKKDVEEIINLAKKEKVGWIRIEPENDEILEEIKKWTSNVHYGHSMSIAKSPHDMQPKETLIMDISKSEEEILTEMKSKTRYNIKLAEKKEVRIKKQEVSEEYIEEFLRLTKIMSERQGIMTHEESYYRKMFEKIPSNILKLYVAEYDGKIIAANVMIFFGDTATYLHGASDEKYKNLMAPHLLQWQAIKDAKLTGCKQYDFFGVKVKNKSGKSWEGVTRFKLGFSPNTETIEYPGCYDIIISPVKYWLYIILQFIKNFIS
jgi:peptidoglycan pentaglycine glycine transferase (the first glycine)